MNRAQRSTVLFCNGGHERCGAQFTIVLPSAKGIVLHETAVLDNLWKDTEAAEDTHIVGCHLDPGSHFCNLLDLLQNADFVSRLSKPW